MLTIKLKTIFTLLFVLCVSTLTTQAATFTVNNNGDSNDASSGDGVCADSAGNCTFRAAAQEANALAGDDTINFSFGAPTTISLTLGEVLLTSNLVVNGGSNAADLTLSGNNNGRVLNVPRSGISITIRGLTIANGSANGNGGGMTVASANVTLENCAVRNNLSSASGGGVYSGSGVFRFVNSTAQNNIAQNNGGGGGLSIAGNNSEITKSRIINNDAPRGGGGVEVNNVVRISNTTIADNTTSGGGGGLLAVFGTAYVTNSTISSNSAFRSGGGIALPYGIVVLTNSTVSGNRVTNGEGGGISTGTNGSSGYLTVRNSTIVNNSANYAGGLTGGLASSAIVGNSIIANNVALTAPNIGANFTSLGGNLVNDQNGGSGYVSTDLPDGTNPLIGALANNGGDTQTHALTAGSPAINAGLNALALDPDGNPLTTDQRGTGFPRISGASVDIGAFEVSSASGNLITVSGRVIVNGRGESRVQIVLTDLSNGETQTVLSNSSGYFRFDNVRENQMYRLEASSKRSFFESQTLMLNAKTSEVILIAQ